MAPRNNRRIPPIADTTTSSRLPNRHVMGLANCYANCAFSFKYLQLSDAVFVVEHDDAGYYHKIIERLQVLSTTSVSELMNSRSSALRCHPIDWSDVKVSRSSFGIPKEEELYDKPYQLTISANEYGRIHGFFTGDTFNIVWFDRKHELYSNR